MGPDSVLDPKAIAACAAFIRKLPPSTPLAFCGSFPAWDSFSTTPLKKAIAQHAKSNLLIADTYGAPLAWLCKLPLRLVKINRSEFNALFPPKKRTDSIAHRLISASKQYPVQAWVVTDGPHPIWFIEKNARPLSLVPEKITQISPTGSGDVFLACILNALLIRKNTLADAVKSAIPFASANAAHPGVAEFDLTFISKTSKLPKS